MAGVLQKIINSPVGIGLAMGIARLLPQSAGYNLANFLAERIAKQNSSTMVQAIRSNQMIVSGHSLSPQQLDEITSATLKHTARCLYDLYHNLRDQEAMRKLIRFGPDALELVSRSEFEDEGLVLVGPHISNFEFILRSASLMGLSAIVIGFARPGPGYRLQNRLRQKSGVKVIPAALESMKQAVEYLKRGGIVVTGVDRPVPDSRYKPRFFGEPASLPVHYVTLALRANVPVVVASTIMRESGIYEILVSRPINMVRKRNRQEEVVYNAEQVLDVVASQIRQAPYQWSMTYSVWPHVAQTIN